MRKKISLLMCIVLMVSFTFGTMNFQADARTTSIEYGAYEAIQKAISEAAPGETIIIPAGEFIIEKPISINRPITLRGTVEGGVLQTVIQGRCANYINVFSDDVRIEGIKFEGRLGLSANEHAINIGDYINFVVKNCEFLNVSYRGVLITGNRAKGVITGCRFENIYNGSGVVVYGVSTGSGENVINTFWDTYPTMDELKNNLGTDNAVYIEDCYFTKGWHAVASNEGGRYVFRYNTMEDPDGTGQSVDTHGLEYQSKRGTRSVEIYNNTLTNSYAHYANIWLRGGDGVVFNNTMTNSTNGLFISHTSEIGQPDPEQIPYPAKDQTRALYAWNNTLDGNPAKIIVRPGHEYLLVENRDFFNYELPGYVPYTYPHPLAADPEPEEPEIWNSKADYTEGTHSLGSSNTGRQMIKFDFESAADNISGTVGYAVYGATVTDQVYMALAIHFDTNGFFKVLNNDTFDSITDLPYIASETYQVKMDIDPLTRTYSVWIKPESAQEILIAENYSFRSGLNVENIGTICLVSNNDGDFSVIDHSIFSYTPFGNVPGAWYSKANASNGFVDGLHVLDPNYAGTVRMEFDFTPHGNSINGVVGFGGKDTDITGYASFSFMFRAYTNGKFDAYNKNTYTALTGIPYAADITYHVKIITDLGSNTYDAWVTPEGEETVMIADDYEYRAATPDIDDIGKVCLVSTNTDDFRIQNFTAETIGEATTPIASPTPSPTPVPEPESLLIEDLVVYNSASLWSAQTNLQPGDLQYADRTFIFDSIPEEVLGCEWIRNANGSKGYTGEILATFTAAKDIDVYIAFSTSIAPLPSWMQEGWEDTGENLVNQENPTTKKAYRLYKKFFAAGSTVVLGSNGTSNHGMYNIILKQRPELITDLVSPAGWVISKNLQQGDKQYGDRVFTFNTIPEIVAGCDWIQNYNGSKGSNDNPLDSFKVGEDANVYVAFSTSAPALPDWFTSGWEDTGEIIQNSEPKSYKLYRRFFPAGSTIELGPNGSANYGMYNIIVKRIERPIIVNDINDITIRMGEQQTINISTNVTGSVVQAVYETPGIAEMSLNGYNLTISAAKVGSTKVTIKANYAGYIEGIARFTLTVTDDVIINPIDPDDDDDDDDDDGTVTTNPDVTPKPIAASAPTPVISDNVIIVNVLDFDAQSGKAKASITMDELEEAFSNADTEERENKVISIEMARVEGATEYTMELPVEILTADTSERKIELKTETANLVIPSNMLSETDVAGAEQLFF